MGQKIFKNWRETSYNPSEWDVLKIYTRTFPITSQVVLQSLKEMKIKKLNYKNNFAMNKQWTSV